MENPKGFSIFVFMQKEMLKQYESTVVSFSADRSVDQIPLSAPEAFFICQIGITLL